LADRFGPLPPPARNLLYLVRVKTLGLAAGVESIAADDGRIVVRMRERLPLLQWQPSLAVESAVTIWRNTFSLEAGAGWRRTLEAALGELVRDAAGAAAPPAPATASSG
jgi:hypothetical protein